MSSTRITRMVTRLRTNHRIAPSLSQEILAHPDVSNFPSGTHDGYMSVSSTRHVKPVLAQIPIVFAGRQHLKILEIGPGLHEIPLTGSEAIKHPTKPDAAVVVTEPWKLGRVLQNDGIDFEIDVVDDVEPTIRFINQVKARPGDRAGTPQGLFSPNVSEKIKTLLGNIMHPEIYDNLAEDYDLILALSVFHLLGTQAAQAAAFLMLASTLAPRGKLITDELLIKTISQMVGFDNLLLVSKTNNRLEGH